MQWGNSLAVKRVAAGAVSPRPASFSGSADETPSDYLGTDRQNLIGVDFSSLEGNIKNKQGLLSRSLLFSTRMQEVRRHPFR